MITFMRVDDRIIHGQIITRWSKEYPCDGIIAVNDKAATTPVLKQSFVASTEKKVFIWTMEHFLANAQKVFDSPKHYFLITKNPIDMATILVDNGFVPNNVKDALEKIYKKGYTITFALVRETAIGDWSKFRGQFGYNG